jgi:paraquat-inducible protein A
MQHFQKLSVYIPYISALCCFLLGLYYPIMGTKIFLGLKEDSSYLTSTISYFFTEGEYFIGILLFIFSLVFPILKFIVVGIRLLNISYPYKKGISNFLDSINKWAMLDVFVVALVIVNMKMDSIFIKTKLEIGTTFFALSIVLLMICTHLLSKQEKKIE